MKPHGVTPCPRCDAFVRVIAGQIDGHWTAPGALCDASHRQIVYDDELSPGRVVAAALLCALIMIACAIASVRFDWRYALGLPVAPLLAVALLCRRR